MTTAEFLSDIDKSLNVECHSVIYPEECGKIINKHYIKVFHVNIQSVQHNFESFLIIFARLNISFDVIVFSECWINEFFAIKQIEGYKSYNTSKYINKSGGVIVYINNKWSANVTEPDIEDANGLIVEVPNVFSLIGQAMPSVGVSFFWTVNVFVAINISFQIFHFNISFHFISSTTRSQCGLVEGCCKVVVVSIRKKSFFFCLIRLLIAQSQGGASAPACPSVATPMATTVRAIGSPTLA
ncbi:hypothetical protein ABMA28_011181 [Loxostege sticticalis]|uniref:Uncharacterized protein n=1 Tax=Loxostege sticticalis TaxID=481309 RepID=A0ABD0S6I4_LOXSC